MDMDNAHTPIVNIPGVGVATPDNAFTRSLGHAAPVLRPSSFAVEDLVEDLDYDEPIDLYGGDAMIDGAYDA